ncbi:TetR/AcrR family transcriptional regulator [Shewanella sp. A25]|nr:TetR/AcrR family transcriptional regulator [Shewanella shenzhenensis]
MARRKEHSHDEIRAMAITAATELLVEQGVIGLSLRKVASKIGYVPSTLINIFGSYQFLLLAVSEQTLLALHEHLAKIKGDLGIARIQAMARAYSEFAHANRQCFKLVFELQLSDVEVPPMSHSELISGLFGLVERELTHVFPQLSPAQQLCMSRVLWGGIHGLTALSLDNKLFADKLSLTALLDNHVTGYLQGVGFQGEAQCC